MTEQRGRLFYGWYVVGGVFTALLLSYGAIYAFGALFTPLSRTFDVNRATTAGVFGVVIALAGGLGVITGPIADRTGPRPLVLIGGLIIGAGLLLASRAQAFWQLYVLYAGGVGIGTGFLLVPSIGVVQHWFVRRRGFASGLAVAGIGAGNLVAPPLVAVLLRVTDWRTVLVVLGVAALVGITAASRLLAPSPEARGLRPDDDPPVAGPASQAAAPIAGQSMSEALHVRHFWLLYAAVLLGGLAVFFPFAHLVPDAESHGIHPVTAAVLLGLVGAGSLAGRFLIGGEADRLGRRRALLITFGGLAVSFLWWLVADQVWSLALFAIVFGVWYGSFAALIPALTADYFGAVHAGATIGVMYTALVPGSLIGPPLAGYFYDLNDSYTVPILVSTATCMLALGLMTLLPEPSVSSPTPATHHIRF